MTVYCETCNKKVEYQLTKPQKESTTIDGLTFIVKQIHAYCNDCGEEVYPSEVIDYFVKNGHRKYLITLLCHFKFLKFMERVYWDIIRLFRRNFYE